MNGMRRGNVGNTPENGQFSDSGLQTLRIYYIILQIMSQQVLLLKTVRSVKLNLRNLTGPSVIVRAVKKI